ncbi:hypothetical protein KI809_18415 [Geobacter pelophilus]|uniref:Uncharacterized protein n=1 Tax=Geoanaerobacter pelophilus TaxID=60036 RepID=A0AAW4L4Z2_9BACT|nr:hypothetical protein [Geoanaerobacter pelophilus]MBT0666289.1 hypothetical protein [Geoanaerobacter pelophilus]
MAVCDLVTKCGYVSSAMEAMPATGKLLANIYCNGHPADCARYIAASVVGIAKVPEDMSPSDDDLAKKILAGNNN